MSGNDRVSPRSTLDELQTKLLEAFFVHERRFFLTGGAALAGFLLGHRTTADLDLFVLEDVLEEGAAALRVAAASIAATVEPLRTAPGFRRLLVRGPTGSVVVDLVFESVEQVAPDKLNRGSIRVDPPEEILANKICTLLSRSELRDLVDVRALELAGYAVEDALPDAARKDGGLTPGQLAWVLSEVTIGEDARPPGGVTVGELRQYLADLVERLSRLAAPGSVSS